MNSLKKKILSRIDSLWKLENILKYYLLSNLYLSACSWEAQTKSIEVLVAVILLSSGLVYKRKQKVVRNPQGI